MKLYPFPEKTGWKMLTAFFLFGLLMLSRDVLAAVNVIGFMKSQMLTIFLVGAAGILFLIWNQKYLPEILRDGRMKLALAATVLILIPMIIKRDFQMMYLSFLFYILTAVFLSYFLDLSQLSRYYGVILSCLAVYSVLATYVFRLLPDKGICQVPTFVNDGDLVFYDFILAQVSQEIARNRNFGIFREPGVYQFFLILGLFLNNEVARWEKPWQLWTINIILSVTMLTTFATGGMVELFLLWTYLFFANRWYRTRTGKWAAALLGLALAGTLCYIVISRNRLLGEIRHMFAKITSPTNGLLRLSAILTDLHIFLTHPLVGDSLKHVLHVVEHNTTTTMILYAGLGIFGGSLHVAAWTALVWDRKRNVFGNLMLLLILFMSFNTENLSWNPYFWLFPMVALAQKGIPFLEGIRKKRTGASGTTD